MKHEETALRLRQALALAEMRPQDLADRSGVSKASISQYMNGTYKPSNISAGKMAGVLGVNPLWLMGFDVPSEPDPDVIDTLTLKERELLMLYRRADPIEQDIIWGILTRAHKMPVAAHAKGSTTSDQLASDADLLRKAAEKKN